MGMGGNHGLVSEHQQALPTCYISMGVGERSSLFKEIYQNQDDERQREGYVYSSKQQSPQNNKVLYFWGESFLS